jgi:soluble lytic murein transglycosylase-like protein
MSLPTMPSFSPNRFNLVSQLLQGDSVQVSRPISQSVSKPVQRSFGGDFLSLATPVSLFKSFLPNFSAIHLSPPIPAVSVNLQGASPTQQLRQLGQKYGVPFQSDANKYQSAVIKAIIRVKAREYGIPEKVALGISGNESSWKMWKNVQTGELVQGRNVRDGVLSSTDWGAMQINDKAHAKAFPRAKTDLEFNVDYALSYLAKQRKSIKGDLGHGLGDWDRTVASYNLGHNPNSQRGYQIAANYVGHVSDRASQFA